MQRVLWDGWDMGGGVNSSTGHRTGLSKQESLGYLKLRNESEMRSKDKFRKRNTFVGKRS